MVSTSSGRPSDRGLRTRSSPASQRVQCRVGSWVHLPPSESIMGRRIAGGVIEEGDSLELVATLAPLTCRPRMHH